MIPHTWQNIGIEQGKLLVLVQPTGQLEEFVMEFSEPISAGSAGAAAVAQLFTKYGMEVVGSPLGSEGKAS